MGEEMDYRWQSSFRGLIFFGGTQAACSFTGTLRHDDRRTHIVFDKSSLSRDSSKMLGFLMMLLKSLESLSFLMETTWFLSSQT